MNDIYEQRSGGLKCKNNGIGTDVSSTIISFQIEGTAHEILNIGVN